MSSTLSAAKSVHRGVFITGPDRLELREDTLPEWCFNGDHIITESLGNCRCSSDKKAIHLFSEHARVPLNATQVALGHECVQRVVFTPPSVGLHPGELVLITPGHFATPHNPETLEPDPENGVIASLGYSYRYLGGLRQFNAVPVKAIDIVKEQGFGSLFSAVPMRDDISLATVAHAEPFACCYGTMEFMFEIGEDGEFLYGVPANARVAFLGGTARMAMIKLTILAARPDDELPEVVAITGSQRKLDSIGEYALIQGLRRRGVHVVFFDRENPDIIDALSAAGPYDAVFTNFPSQDVYDQAVAIIAPGGNLNNYAGAVDPNIYFSMEIGATRFESPREEARAQIRAMHHNVGPNDPKRSRGIAPDAAVLFVGFDDEARLAAYLEFLPPGTRGVVEGRSPEELAGECAGVTFSSDLPSYTDVFIAGSGAAAAAEYSRVETKLERCAAVNMVDGDTTLKIRSKHSHYASRHQICGPTVPYWMTNTSEPLSEFIAMQGRQPVDFDWLVKGVAGVDHAVEMIEDVSRCEHFGSFFGFTQIGDFPYVAVNSDAFRAKARELRQRNAEGPAIAALERAAVALEENGDAWCRRAEEEIYEAFGVAYPLSL